VLVSKRDGGCLVALDILQVIGCLDVSNRSWPQGSREEGFILLHSMEFLHDRERTQQKNGTAVRTLVWQIIKTNINLSCWYVSDPNIDDVSFIVRFCFILLWNVFASTYKERTMTYDNV
jgi:hypothetical protein